MSLVLEGAVAVAGGALIGAVVAWAMGAVCWRRRHRDFYDNGGAGIWRRHNDRSE